MSWGKILAAALAFGLGGPLGASTAGANPAAALFASPLTAGEACRVTPENPVSKSPCTFLTSSALVPDLRAYDAPGGSSGLMALLEISR